MQRTTDPRLQAIANSHDGEMALIEAFYSAFGTSVPDTIEAIKTMAAKKLRPLTVQCITAGVQIRANTTFVRVSEAQEVPNFVISSLRPGIPDSVNFKAMHMAGHLIALLGANHPLGRKMIGKGNCLTGVNLGNNEAGKINKEIYDGLSEADRSLLSSFLASKDSEPAKAWVDMIFKAMEEAHKQLSKGE